MVTKKSAGPHSASLVSIDADHFSICRPTDRTAVIYGRVRDFIARHTPAPRVPSLAREGETFIIHTDGRPEYVLPRSLQKELPGRNDTKHAEHWKRVHTIAEKLYIVSRSYQGSIAACKVSVEHGWRQEVDRHRGDAAKSLGYLRSSWQELVDTMRGLPRPVLGNPCVDTLCKLPLCVDPLVRSLGAGIGKDLDAAIALSEAIEQWQLTTLQFADRVLEQYFEKQAKRRTPIGARV